MNSRADDDSLAVLLDRGGRVLWYRKSGGGAFSLARASTGTLIL